jgi:NAD(P)-dependent dehydrogenase (short-subunit alcohol dehydrogenase family)
MAKISLCRLGLRRFDLSDRVVVTGASKGMGRELTILFAETGAVVVPTVRADADAASVATEARSRGGRIVNISSQGGLVGLPGAAVYCAGKGGLNMMTKTLAPKWAKEAITVNAVAPTFIYTPRTAPILDEPKMRAAVLGKIPLGQFALTNDVAGAIIYLASDAGRMVAGMILVVDGGWTSQ